jgi:hypothetical protein
VDAGDEGGADGPEADQQDADLSLGRSDLLSVFLGCRHGG